MEIHWGVKGGGGKIDPPPQTVVGSWDVSLNRVKK